MKQLLVVAALALGLTIFVAPTALPAAPSDAQGPPCTNITNGDGGYGEDAVLDFTVFLQAPACSFVTYSFFVTDTSGNAITPDTATQDANCLPETEGGGCVHFVYTLPIDSPSLICIYARTDIHRHLADRAPDPPADQACPASSPSVSLLRGAGGASGTFG